MANHKRVAAGGENELPPEIIHIIQSFLEGKEAARTAILNKSWWRAWSTRPNLVLDRHGCGSCDVVSEYLKKTMRRYEDMNLTIHSLRLRMVAGAETGPSLANELIGKAMKLGATDLDLDLFILEDPHYFLPDEVLRSDALARISVSGFAMRLNKEATYYSNLKSIYIESMTVEGHLFRDWISRCPSVEELTLSSLRLRLSREKGDRRLDFHNLRYLRLGFLDTKNILRMARFHCLKELVITEGDNSWNNIRICSPSLEIISICLYNDRIWNAVFDVPNIRRFVFDGCPNSRLRFRSTTRREWESEFRTYLSQSHPDLWFSRLKKFVKMLATISKVSLHISVSTYLKGYRYVGDGLPLSPVENVTVMVGGIEQRYPAFLDNLFLVCRPKLLTIRERSRRLINDYLLEIVRRGLVEEVKEC